MKRLTILMLPVAACLALASCATRSYVAAPINAAQLAQPDSELTRPCTGPASAPPRRLTQLETERLLTANTSALIVCRDRHAGLVSFYRVRDAGLTGNH